MKTSRFPYTFATLAVALLALLAFPAAAQKADFTMYVSIGDSLTMGITDACLVEHGQRDSYPAIIARQASSAAFEQPLVSEHGLGGCMYLKSLLSATGTLDPVFGNWPSDGVPLNSTLARPYNNLGIDGFKIHDVVATNPTTPEATAAFLTLRGQGTALQQAAFLKPTFLTIFIGADDFLPAITSATAIPCPDPRVPGCTLTAMSSVNADLDTIFNTLKAAQGGTAKGVVLNMGDPLIPFVTTVSPVLGYYPEGTPAAGQPIYALSNVGCPEGVPVCPVPPGSYLTLVAGQYLKAGYGVPCAILPPTDPRQANCNKPLPDNYSVNPSTGAVSPGVVLTPPEFAAIRLEAQQINTALQAKATAAGYKVFDTAAFFADVLANGRSYGGLSVTATYLGGIFSNDGAHLTSLGYAILANALIEFINATYGNTIVQADLYPFLFNGNTSPGGYPLPPPAGMALTPGDEITWAAAVFGPENWRQNLPSPLPDLGRHLAPIGNPQETPISIDREVPGTKGEKLN
jgi:phospholipase/lecithinase/hemolysin